ncbi:MAG: hypothetical protein LKI22_08335 [Liquorilactobacillus nagelii]|uniref:hypothetical protein n=1 Tax=Liquorilactobacillus nagelii TaxID=82688 RepID=UPI002431F600|nr:hypothetical protein [Liquorilactobacillus nagelii]MCI1633904.1 hypothetical protein [Liquorilactobacillus nagelii]
MIILTEPIAANGRALLEKSQLTVYQKPVNLSWQQWLTKRPELRDSSWFDNSC